MIKTLYTKNAVDDFIERVKKEGYKADATRNEYGRYTIVIHKDDDSWTYIARETYVTPSKVGYSFMKYCKLPQKYNYMFYC